MSEFTAKIEKVERLCDQLEAALVDLYAASSAAYKASFEPIPNSVGYRHTKEAMARVPAQAMAAIENANVRAMAKVRGAAVPEKRKITVQE